MPSQRCMHVVSQISWRMGCNIPPAKSIYDVFNCESTILGASLSKYYCLSTLDLSTDYRQTYCRLD